MAPPADGAAVTALDRGRAGTDGAFRGLGSGAVGTGTVPGWRRTEPGFGVGVAIGGAVGGAGGALAAAVDGVTPCWRRRRASTRRRRSSSRSAFDLALAGLGVPPDPIPAASIIASASRSAASIARSDRVTVGSSTLAEARGVGVAREVGGIALRASASCSRFFRTSAALARPRTMNWMTAIATMIQKEVTAAV